MPSPKPRNIGRKTKRNPALTQAICDVLRVGGTRAAAVGHVGVHISTFLDWMDRFPEFAEQITRAEAEAELRYTSMIFEAARSGDVRASSFWLERRRPEEWGQRAKTEVAVTFDVAALLRENLTAKQGALPEPTVIDVTPPEEDEPPPPSHNGTNGKVH